MKKTVSVLLCIALLISLSSCVSYRKTDIFSFLEDYEKLEPQHIRQENMLKKDDTYYVYYKTNAGDTYLLTVSVDEFSTPQTVRMYFTEKLTSSADIVFSSAQHCISAFCGYDEGKAEQIISELCEKRNESLFTLYEKKTEDEQYNFQIRSVILFTAFEFTLNYASVK